jgi:hypothetical protein
MYPNLNILANNRLYIIVFGKYLSTDSPGLPPALLHGSPDPEPIICVHTYILILLILSLFEEIEAPDDKLFEDLKY